MRMVRKTKSEEPKELQRSQEFREKLEESKNAVGTADIKKVAEVVITNKPPTIGMEYIVEAALRANPALRDGLQYRALYMVVAEVIGGRGLSDKGFDYILKNCNELHLPNIQWVVRTQRKIQDKYPELRVAQ